MGGRDRTGTTRWLALIIFSLVLVSLFGGSALGQDDLDQAAKLNRQVVQLYQKGCYGEAILLAKRVLDIREKTLDPDHLYMAYNLNNLAVLYGDLGDYSRAMPLHERAMAIFEKTLGPDHPAVATSLNNLAELYGDLGVYSRAESLYERAMAINEKALGLGSGHKDVATDQSILAGSNRKDFSLGEYSDLCQAELSWVRAQEKLDLAVKLSGQVKQLCQDSHYNEAILLAKKSLAIFEKYLGPDLEFSAILEEYLGPDNLYILYMSASLNNLAVLYMNLGDYSRAEPLFKRALAIRERALGPHNTVAEDMAALRNNDPIKRYFAVNELRHEARLSEKVVNLLIKYLSDVRGEYPGNTIAGAAAEVLAKYPQHAKRALPELMRLLAYTEKYAMPSGSAAKAIRTVKRVDLEAYLADLNKKERIELSNSLLPVIENGIGSIRGLATISMILGMLGNDVAIPILESTYASAKTKEGSDSYFKEIRIRSGSAIKILKNEWKINDLNYFMEMKAADSLLGIPDQYIFTADSMGIQTGNEPGFKPILVKEIKNAAREAGARNIYLLVGSDKLPGEYLLLWNSAARKTYPNFKPTQKRGLMEVTVNGQGAFDRLFRDNYNIREGYVEDKLYFLVHPNQVEGESKDFLGNIILLDYKSGGKISDMTGTITLKLK